MNLLKLIISIKHKLSFGFSRLLRTISDDQYDDQCDDQYADQYDDQYDSHWLRSQLGMNAEGAWGMAKCIIADFLVLLSVFNVHLLVICMRSASSWKYLVDVAQPASVYYRYIIHVYIYIYMYIICICIRRAHSLHSISLRQNWTKA